ncbi:MAG: CDP-glycerol glycerophosphotransferase family protein [Promethearchaeota archaeon]
MKQNIIHRILRRFTYLKSSVIYQFSQEIIYSWILKAFSHFFPSKIDNKLIILSSIGGNAFVDNTKYIFKYLVKHTRYKVVWITKSDEDYNKLSKEGYNVEHKFTLQTIKLLRRAKFIFTTHGMLDILPIKLSPKTIFVLTWHGVQNKRNSSEHGPIKYTKWARYFKLSIDNNNFIDYFITPSGTRKDKRLIMNYFQITPDKIITTGYPRNDILFSKDPNLNRDLRNRFEIPNEIERIILYAPTFRDNLLTAKFPLTKSELIDLNNLMKDTNSILIMKAHMAEQTIEFKSLSNIKKAPQNADIQELLYITNILITDYSSVYCDFLLLNRPIILFTYDYDHFMKYGRGFYYNFKEIAPGPLIFTTKELFNAIVNISKINENYEARRIKTRKIYHKYVDGKSTERLLKFLKII